MSLLSVLKISPNLRLINFVLINKECKVYHYIINSALLYYTSVNYTTLYCTLVNCIILHYIGPLHPNGSVPEIKGSSTLSFFLVFCVFVCHFLLPLLKLVNYRLISNLKCLQKYPNEMNQSVMTKFSKLKISLR